MLDLDTKVEMYVARCISSYNSATVYTMYYIIQQLFIQCITILMIDYLAISLTITVVCTVK